MAHAQSEADAVASWWWYAGEPPSAAETSEDGALRCVAFVSCCVCTLHANVDFGADAHHCGHSMPMRSVCAGQIRSRIGERSGEAVLRAQDQRFALSTVLACGCCLGCRLVNV
jgi:hypothetical protein